MLELILQKIRNFRLIFYVICTLTVLPFLVLSAFNHPASDDYCYTNLVNNEGFWGAQMYYYFNWTGRYTATFFLTLNPIDFHDLVIYKILPIFLFLGSFLSIFLLIKKISPKNLKQDQLTLSFLIFFLYIYYIPSMPEAFYWRAGSVTYQLASITSLLFFAAILHMQQQLSVPGRIIYTFIACILAVLTIGFNETSMVILLGIVFIWTLACFMLNKEKKVEMGIIFLFTAAASATVILAPGNAIRMAEKPEKFQLLFSLLGATKLTILFILNWIPMTVLLISLFSPVLNRMSKRLNNNLNSWGFKLWHLAVSGLFLFGFIVLCFFPSFWSQGGRPPYRTINLIYLLFIFGTFFLTVWFFILLQNKNFPVPKLSIKGQLFLSVIIIFLLFLKPNNIQEAYSDLLTGTAYRYHLEMEERYQLLENCSNESCTVPALENKPETILSSDLSDKPSHEGYYYNECLSYYFHKKRIDLQVRETAEK